MGLRRGELLRLTVGDYDPSGRTILIRESKFHKSRLLPLSSDAAREVQAFLSIRRCKQIPVSTDSPLLCNSYRGATPYTGTGLGSTIRGLFVATGIRTPAGKSPRVHDFRHSFAVHALVRWYRDGINVQAKLPLLATYMGHVSVVSTAYYLHFAEQVATQASERFAQRCAVIISENSASGGDQ
jgi:integrase